MELTPENFEIIMKQQREVESLADVSYQIYYEKITFSEFYKKYVWDVIENRLKGGNE